MERPNPDKRLRLVASSPRISSSSSSSQNFDTKSFPNVSDVDQKQVNQIISSLMSLQLDSISIGCAFECAFENLLDASRDDKSVVVDHGIELASMLHEATKKCARKLATTHNSVSWPLPNELTVKVFSMVDTKSLVQASAACNMFKESASDPICFANIDLTTENVTSTVVRSMIFNAGKELRILKIGCQDKSTKSYLTRTCLTPLSYNRGLIGNLLETLHLYNHGGRLKQKSICGALSVCSNLTDLKIVGLDIDVLDDLVDLLTINCQHLFLQKENSVKWMNYINGSLFEKNCPNLTSLSFIGFNISDIEAYRFLMGLRQLKYIDLSKSPGIEGYFLRLVSHNFTDAVIETIILQDCLGLKERMVCRFLDSLLSGHLGFVRHIDVSNDHGLLCGEGRCRRPNFPLEELEVERPGLTFVADFRPSPYTLLSSSSSSSSSDSSHSSSSTDSSS